MKNVINFNREPCYFYKRDQREGKTSKEYITVLYELIETCEYGTMRDKLLCDCLIIVGICNKMLSEKLQFQEESQKSIS